MNRIDLKKEAVRRMELLEFKKVDIESFIKNENPYIQPKLKSYEILDILLSDVDNLEKNKEKKVYAILPFWIYGTITYNFLYTHTMIEDWQLEENYLKNGFALAYVKNLDFPEFSEYGLITVEMVNGVLKRIE